ncbi:Qat anti-phage system QueC-like protein QatC [Corallococcus exercitus]|uniref:Qat anti-phage system QueC-like protein QatC n=1 Tax=Corallococcus exercitus TaxID=2316736 RepID=UPI0035D3F2CB
MTREIHYALYDHAPNSVTGTAGASLYWVLRKLKLAPAPHAWDFLSIALSAIAADEGCSRSISPDGWTREIDLSIAVIDRPFWTAQAPQLESALRFLTGDIWRIDFMEGGTLPDFTWTQLAQNADSVCLLSGGVDSLVGAIDLVSTGKQPLLVSQIAKGDKHTQRDFAARIAPTSVHLQLNHLVRPPGPSERSQRARSLIFIAYGIIAATSLDRHRDGEVVELFMPENGYISLNIPLTSLRLGSLSTRTTHPVYLAKLQKVLTAANLRVSISNPFQFKTKGEMLLSCANQELLRELVFRSTSCGRYARSGFEHCGRCVPCLIRRAAVHRWGLQDLTSYKYKDLSLPGPRHRGFDDVKSACMAIETIKRSGIENWIGGALNSADLGNAAPYISIAERGVLELRSYFESIGIS